MAINIVPDDVTTQVVKDLGVPQRDVVLLRGYIGKSLPPDPPSPPDPTTPQEVYWRLYRTAECNEYILFRQSDVVWYKALATSGSTYLAGSVVWLKEGAEVKHVRVRSYEVQAGFLQGRITGGRRGRPMRRPGGGGGGGGGGGSWAECGGGSWAECGGGSWAECGGGSWAECGGGSWAECGGGSWAECGGGSWAECGG
jgi:hypothetical protein